MRLTFMLFSPSFMFCFSLSIFLYFLGKSSPLQRSWHIIKTDRQRYGGVEAHQHRDIGDPGMTEHLHPAIVETLGNPTRISECGSHLVDHLLAFICERGRQPA